MFRRKVPLHKIQLFPVLPLVASFWFKEKHKTSYQLEEKVKISIVHSNEYSGAPKSPCYYKEISDVFLQHAAGTLI